MDPKLGRMKYLPLILSFILFKSISNCQRSYIHEPSGVIISFVSERNMFPMDWMIDESNPKTENLNPEEYSRTKEIINRALNKYPVSLLQINLRKIYALSYLEFYDMEYGGTYYNDVLYITNKGILEGYDDVYVEQTIHHEFSSILYWNYIGNYSETKWSECNDENASYGEGGFEALGTDDADLNFNADMHKLGFLYAYGRSDKENDFNSFVENLFKPTDGFWYIVDEYPCIKCKVELLIELFQQLHPRFTLSYFKSLN